MDMRYTREEKHLIEQRQEQYELYRRVRTDGGEHCGGEVKSSFEFPLCTCLMGHGFDDDSGQDFKVLLGDVVLPLQHPFHCVQSTFLGDFMS